MAQNDVKFNLGDGGLGIQLPNEDHVSGLIFGYIGKPGSWPNEIRSFRSVKALEAAGILDYDPLYGFVHYQVEEYFRQQPNGEIYIGFNTAFDKDIMFQQTDGRVRQWGFFGGLTYAASVQTIMEGLFDLHAPAVAVVGYTPTLNTASIDDLFTKTYPQVAILAAGDGEAEGEQLRLSYGLHYIASVGALLGATALAKVNESTAWVGKFNLSNGVELESPRLATGVLLKDTLTATLDELHDKGWTYLRKHTGKAGTYFNDNYTATDQTSDYSTINNNRTIQKAVRVVRAALLDEVSAPVEVDPDTGKLANGYVEYLKSLGDAPLDTMDADGETSGSAVNIDPNQDVLSTSNVQVGIEVVPFGVSRNLIVNIGLAANLG